VGSSDDRFRIFVTQVHIVDDPVLIWEQAMAIPGEHSIRDNSDEVIPVNHVENLPCFAKVERDTGLIECNSHPYSFFHPDCTGTSKQEAPAIMYI